MEANKQVSVIHTKEGPINLEVPLEYIHICLCTYCDGWWNEGEIPKHTVGCNRPQEGP